MSLGVLKAGDPSSKASETELLGLPLLPVPLHPASLPSFLSPSTPHPCPSFPTLHTTTLPRPVILGGHLPVFLFATTAEPFTWRRERRRVSISLLFPRRPSLSSLPPTRQRHG